MVLKILNFSNSVSCLCCQSEPIYLPSFPGLIAESLQVEQLDRRLPNSGAPNEFSEVKLKNTLADSPLTDANDNGTAGCSTSAKYPVMQFTVSDVRRRRKNGFMLSHANKAYCREKTTR